MADVWFFCVQLNNDKKGAENLPFLLHLHANTPFYALEEDNLNNSRFRSQRNAEKYKKTCSSRGRYILELWIQPPRFSVVSIDTRLLHLRKT